MALPPVLDDENLYKFRTKLCERYVKQGKCEFADKCQYSHDLRWTRRPPWKYTYSPELCKDLVFMTDGRGRNVAKSSCKQKRNCKQSHTKEEQMYHPKIYKTVLCNQHIKNGWCDRYYCPFAHSVSELREVDCTYDPKSILSKIDQESHCPDIYLPSDRPHPRLRSRFLSIMDGIPHNRHTLGLDPTKLSAPGYRTRQPYTDFISSHTPHSVCSNASSPMAEAPTKRDSCSGQSIKAMRKADGLYNALAGQQDEANSSQHLANQPMPCVSGEQHPTTQLLVQLLQAKQTAAQLPFQTNAGECIQSASSKETKFPLYIPPGDSTLSQILLTSAISTTSDAAIPSTSSYISTSAIPLLASPYVHTDKPESYPIAKALQDSQSFAFLKGSVGSCPESFDTGAFKQTDSFVSHDTQAVSYHPGPQHGSMLLHDGHALVPSVGSWSNMLTHVADSITAGQAQQPSHPTGTLSLEAAISSLSGVHSVQALSKRETAPCNQTKFLVRCLSDDVCYWNEPIGHSRDDPSVLVFSGLLLGPEENERDVVAVKQLPVVVTNRAGALQMEMARYKSFSHKLLVNIRKVIFHPGDKDEGTSLWVVTDRCQGTLEKLLPLQKFSALALHECSPHPLVARALSQLLTALLILHQQSGSAHMRIHPGNIMVSHGGDIRLGDCAGKIRYFSIIDLLCAGLQGAKNANALVQWILNTPLETCWMAPEMIRSLISLSDTLSNYLWCRSCCTGECGDDSELASLAAVCKWDLRFLQTADAWAFGATIFYFVTGGLHPFGDISSSTVRSILAGKKRNFEKLRDSPLLFDLLDSLLCPDVSQRLDLPKALCHPVFWQQTDYVTFFQALYITIEDTNSTESEYLLRSLSYDIQWVDCLLSISSIAPLLPWLLCYVSDVLPLSRLPHPQNEQTASSFLAFLGLVSLDQRLAIPERITLVKRCTTAFPNPFLNAVRLFLYNRVPSGTFFTVQQESSYISTILGPLISSKKILESLNKDTHTHLSLTNNPSNNKPQNSTAICGAKGTLISSDSTHKAELNPSSQHGHFLAYSGVQSWLSGSAQHLNGSPTAKLDFEYANKAGEHTQGTIDKEHPNSDATHIPQDNTNTDIVVNVVSSANSQNNRTFKAIPGGPDRDITQALCSDVPTNNRKKLFKDSATANATRLTATLATGNPLTSLCETVNNWRNRNTEDKLQNNREVKIQNGEANNVGSRVRPKKRTTLSGASVSCPAETSSTIVLESFDPTSQKKCCNQINTSISQANSGTTVGTEHAIVDNYVADHQLISLNEQTPIVKSPMEDQIWKRLESPTDLSNNLGNFSAPKVCPNFKCEVRTASRSPAFVNKERKSVRGSSPKASLIPMLAGENETTCIVSNMVASQGVKSPKHSGGVSEGAKRSRILAVNSTVSTAHSTTTASESSLVHSHPVEFKDTIQTLPPWRIETCRRLNRNSLPSSGSNGSPSKTTKKGSKGTPSRGKQSGSSAQTFPKLSVRGPSEARAGEVSQGKSGTLGMLSLSVNKPQKEEKSNIANTLHRPEGCRIQGSQTSGCVLQ